MSFLHRFLLVMVFIPAIANADSSISWSDFDQYTDIEATEEKQQKFEARFKKSIEEHLAKLATSLPSGQKVWIKITDIDLAGRVLPGLSYGGNTPRDYRIVEHHYYPKLDLNFHLSDSTGKVLQKGKLTLKDISFLDRFRTRSQKRDSFHYEKTLLTDWFKTTFPREVAKK